MIGGDIVCLRPWRESDINFLGELRNDVAIQSQLLSRVRGSSRVQIHDWIQKFSSSNDRLFFVIARCQDNEPVGFVQVTEIDYIDRRGELGICIGRQYQGRRYGTEAVSLISTYLAKHWNYRKLYLRVRSDNFRAYHLYQASGFRECGRLISHVFIEGHWHDVALMELLFEGNN
jgi:diamine N-acetyltransferase